MKKFDHGGKADGSGTVRTGVGVGQQQKCGAKALAASTEKIAGDFADGLISAGALTRQFLFDKDEVVANQIENFLDCQKRDGTFSWAGPCGPRTATRGTSRLKEPAAGR